MSLDWGAFFDGYTRLREGHRGVLPSLSKANVDKLFFGFVETRRRARQQRSVSAPNANIFSVLGIERREMIHSRFLSWLLNHLGSHEQGSLFFRHLGPVLGVEWELVL